MSWQRPRRDGAIGNGRGHRRSRLGATREISRRGLRQSDDIGRASELAARGRTRARARDGNRGPLGVPASAGRNAHFLLLNAQLEHRSFFQTLEHPITGPTPDSNLPLRFSALGEGLETSPAPTIGQHNDEVLGDELGLSQEELEGLRDKKIIGERPDF